MNPTEETNLLAEIAVLRSLVKLLIGYLPADAATTTALQTLTTQLVETAPPYTQQRVALQRAVKLIDPLAIPRRS
ncbi:MAG: hypothetical protein JSS17_18175 [Proteobacteria bacterium]|nr:hypothetical protein [Pseudomonadota bacterium]MBS0575755.1 hypothetical protein [Pseudomonadota bacterium]